MIKLDLHHCQCPFCEANSFSQTLSEGFDPTAIYDNALRCQSCGQEYDVIWGVPFLGRFEQADIMNLIEVASNADNYSRTKNSEKRDTGESGGIDYAQWQDLLNEYHSSPNRDTYLKSHGITPEVAAWFPNRYGEHVYFRALTSSISLKGRQVLDVGAGPGFDSYKLVRAGSIVTCLEFSPILAHEGLCQVPQARWFAGSSNALPFQNGSFDLVVANAALHHMRDIPAAIAEMLRVLKPDGYLLTLCDSYRKTGSDENVEIEVFKDDPTVLMGVNEGIPPLGDFLTTLKQYHNYIDVDVFTSEVHGLQTNSWARTLKMPTIGKRNLLSPKRWSLDQALEMLPNTSGGLALRVRLRKPLIGQTRRLIISTIRPAEFARSLETQSDGIAKLAAFVPMEYIDLPLLDREPAKFRLLNGWKLPTAGLSYRTVYGRGRSFHTYRAEHRAIRLSVLVPHVDKSDRPKLVVALNGCVQTRRSLCRGLWSEMIVPVDHLQPGSITAIEIRLDTSLPEPAAKVFHVRECGFGPSGPEQGSDESDLEQFGLEALAHIGLIGPSHVLVLFSLDYALGVMAINRLRELGITVRAIVAKEQVAFYCHEPGIEISGTYEEEEQMEVDRVRESRCIDLIVAPNLQSAHELIQLTCSQGAVSRYFVMLPGGRVTRVTSQVLAQSSSKARRGERLVAFRQIAAAILKRFMWARP